MAGFDPFAAALENERPNGMSGKKFDPFAAALSNEMPPAPKSQAVDNTMSLEPPKPLSAKIVDAINPFADKASQMDNPLAAAELTLAQGGVDAARNFYLLMRDIGDAAGISDKKVTKEARANFDSEKEQFNQLPAIQRFPVSTGIGRAVTAGAIESLPWAKGAQALGLVGSTLARGIAGGALTGAGAAAVQDPGQVDNPLDQRLKVQAPIGAAIGGGLSAVGGGIRNYMAGKYSPAAAAAQTDVAANAQKFGVNLPVPQITGTAASQAVQTGLARLPIVGTRGSVAKLNAGVADAQADFMKSLEQPFDKSKEIYKRVIDKVNATMSQKLGKDLVPDGLYRVPLTSANKVAGQVSSNVKELGLDPSNKVAEWTHTLSTKTSMPMEGGLDLLHNLDDAIDQVKKGTSIGSYSKADLPRLSSIRAALSEDLTRAAEKAGAGTDFAWGKQVSKQESALKDVKDIFQKTAIGGLKPLAFGKQLIQESEDIADKLTPELKDTLKGLNQLYTAAYNVLGKKFANPQDPTILGAMGAGAVMQPGKTAAAAGLVKFASYMLDSNLGRNMLTHIGRLKPGSAKAGDLTNRLIQGMLSIYGEQQTSPLIQPSGQ